MPSRSSRRLGLGGKLTLGYSLLIVLVAGVLMSSLNIQLRNALRRGFRDRLRDGLDSAALRLESVPLAALAGPADLQSPAGQAAADQLAAIARTTPIAARVAVLRRGPGGLSYVLDYAPGQSAAPFGAPFQAAPPAEPLSAPLVEPELAADSADRPVIRGFAPIAGDLLLIEADASPILAQEARGLRISAIEFATMLLLALPLGFWLTRRLTAPIAGLTGAAARVAAGDLGQTVPARTNDELGELARAFNTMAAALQARIDAERAGQDELRASNQELQRLLDLVRDLEIPVIPLLRGALVAPIVGRIDQRRIGALAQVVLEAVHRQRARAVLLDVTGVSGFDADAGRALRQLAQSVRLLGARVVITGIGAEIARTLVGLDLDLADFQTAANLEDGVAALLKDAGAQRS